MNKIVKLAPGIQEQARKMDRVRNHLHAAYSAALVHDRFYDALSKGKKMKVGAFGQRGGEFSFTTKNETEFEKLFDVVMDILRSRIENEMTMSEKLKKEL